MAAALLAVLICTAVISSCQKGESVDDITARKQAKLRFVHASANAGALDVYYNGLKRTDEPMNYFDTTAYFDAGQGTDLSVDFKLAGTVNTVASQLLSLRALNSYTVYLTGLKSGDSYSGLSTILSSDTLTAPAAGNAKIRLVQASPDAGNVEFWIDADSIRNNVPFRTVTNMQEVKAEKYSFSIRAKGTTTVLAKSDLTLEEGKIYTLLLRGLKSGSPAPLVLSTIRNN